MQAVQPVVTLYVEQLLGPLPQLATLAGMAFSITGVADLLASPFLGKNSDEIGYRRVLLICLLGAALATAPQALAHSYWTFLLERFGVGCFIGGILPTANALVGRLVSRATAVSYTGNQFRRCSWGRRWAADRRHCRCLVGHSLRVRGDGLAADAQPDMGVDRCAGAGDSGTGVFFFFFFWELDQQIVALTRSSYPAGPFRSADRGPCRCARRTGRRAGHSISPFSSQPSDNWAYSCVQMLSVARYSSPSKW